MSRTSTRITGFAGAVGLAAMLAVLSPGAAQAAGLNCGLNAGTGNVSGAPAYSYTTAQNVSCSSVQARVYRYEGSTIRTTTGTSSTQSSYISATGGTAAGGAVRGNDGSAWSSWIAV